MATLSEKLAAEHKMRKLLETQNLPQPDEVEYGYTCVRLFWHDTKQVVVIQIDEPPPGFVFAEDMSEEERERVLRDPGDPDESEMPFERYRPGPN